MENQQTFMTDPWTKWFLYRSSIWLKVASMGFHVGLKKHHFSMGIRHGKKKNTKKYHQIFTAEARGTAFSDSKGSNFPVRP